jgi:acyl carrier protein
MPTSHATAPTTTAAAFKDDLLHFINAVLPKTRGKPREPTEVDGSTSLFESGLIDSLAIVQLIAFVERATGQGIPPRMVVIKHFRTAQAICETFGPRQEQKYRGGVGAHLRLRETGLEAIPRGAERTRTASPPDGLSAGPASR